MPVAALLIAHGSRRAEANADLVQLAEIVLSKEIFPIVEIAYLDVVQPDVPTGIRRCITQRATEVRMLPYFLSAGAHVVDDLEHYRSQFAAEFPDVKFTICPPLGLDPLMVDLVLKRLDQASN